MNVNLQSGKPKSHENYVLMTVKLGGNALVWSITSCFAKWALICIGRLLLLLLLLRFVLFFVHLIAWKNSSPK